MTYLALIKRVRADTGLALLVVVGLAFIAHAGEHGVTLMRVSTISRRRVCARSGSKPESSHMVIATDSGTEVCAHNIHRFVVTKLLLPRTKPLCAIHCVRDSN